ncbi:MAG: ribosome biogenesis GTPase Der [Myxococcales bacterium]|nr:ribosome biogenesis GTPase Der [Myxococcales bacterium]
MKPVVAIVGRPNVGKSTLFNRLAGRRLALVENVPGVTRDRNYADAEWGGRTFTLVDTGGFIPAEREVLQREVREQAQAAVEEADLILFVVDGRAGLTATDQEVADFLRRGGKRVFLAVNKVDTEKVRDAAVADFYRLGLGELFDVSAEHGRGLTELVDGLLGALPPAEEEEERGEAIRLAVVGRPNVGKSTLVNALLGEQRLITSAVAGTTRDAIDAELSFEGRRFVLTDTAGIRRKSTIAHRLEQYAVLRALKAIERSDVAALVLDATEPAVDQDARIASLAEEKGRALVLVVNKWDLVRDRVREEDFRAGLKRRLPFVAWAPVVFISALEGQRVQKLLELAARLNDQTAFRAPTPRLNRLLEHVSEEHPAPFAKGRRIRLYYAAQVGASPPTFAFVCNLPQQVPQQYKRYLEHQLRDAFELKVPIRLLFRERPGKARREAKVGQMIARRRR